MKRKHSKRYIIRAIKSLSKAFGASEESIYTAAYILVLHNAIESIMDDFILYINHNPYMDEINFKDKIINKIGFVRKVDVISKYIPKDISNKLIRFNELRNRYAHRIIDIGRSPWKQISQEEADKYLKYYVDILHDLSPKRRIAQKQYFEHSDILDEADGML